ncbi:hypothetical protein DFH07DRAFT_957050 [Mycena maculata]|uniref:Uncharacterized protein n=1 Tax=Mycena maculata TaxID=230809 RepID=A0AAD7NID7_9AGAR|nr:hypothetical protein DFH07DRAFT_957050 [Mycena maculata]
MSCPPRGRVRGVEVTERHGVHDLLALVYIGNGTTLYHCPPHGGLGYHPPSYTVELADGRRIPADVAVACIGGTPLSALLLALSPSSLADRIFAIGYAADTSAHKAAGPGHRQAQVAVHNIVRMIAGYSANAAYMPSVPRIRVSVGLHSDVTSENPRAEGRAPGVLFIDMEDGTHEEEEMSRMYEWRVKRAGARGHRLLPVLVEYNSTERIPKV